MARLRATVNSQAPGRAGRTFGRPALRRQGEGFLGAVLGQVPVPELVDQGGDDAAPLVPEGTGQRRPLSPSERPKRPHLQDLRRRAPLRKRTRLPHTLTRGSMIRSAQAAGEAPRLRPPARRSPDCVDVQVLQRHHLLSVRWRQPRSPLCSYCPSCPGPSGSRAYGAGFAPPRCGRRPGLPPAHLCAGRLPVARRRSGHVRADKI